MKKNIWIPLATGSTILLLWECSVLFFHVPLYVLPAPHTILLSLIENYDILFQHAVVTLSEALLGFAIALLLAILIAIFMDISNTFHRSVYPYLVVSQTLPVMVLAPLFSIWLGFGMAPKVWMVIFMCFFPMVISFREGLTQVSVKQIALLKSYQASRWQIYKLVKIPSALPSLFSGMQVAITYCIGGAMVGEWISSSTGLGYYMLRMKNGYMLDKVFATVVVVIILSLILNGCVRWLKYRICSYQYK